MEQRVRSIATALSIALIVAACAPTPSQTPSPSASRSATSSASPGPSPTQPPVLGVDWGNPDLIGGAFGAGIRSVAGGPAGVVAVGSVIVNGRTTGQAWFSSDGRAWSVAEPEASFAGAPILDVVAGSDGFVAVGYEIEPAVAENQTTGTRRALTWTSADGRRWARGEAGPDLEDAALRLVVATGEGFIAVGTDAATGDPASCRPTLTFASTDGISWARLPADPDMACEFITALAAVGDGLIAIATSSRDGSRVVSAWASEDGSGWTGIDGFAPGWESASDIAAGPNGVVVLGKPGAGGSPTGVRFSVDGDHWEEGSGDPVVSSYPFLGGVVAMGDGFIALGVGGVATSSDGRTWSNVSEGPGPSFGVPIRWLSTYGDLVLAIGGQERELVSFVSPEFPTSPAVDTPEFSLESAVVPTVEGRPSVRSIAAGAGGLVAVGFDRPPDLGDRLAIWHSVDGHEWALLDTDLGWGSIEAVTAYGDGFAAVGDERAIKTGTEGSEPAPATWLSDDGIEWRRTTIDTMGATYPWPIASRGATLVIGTWPRFAEPSPDCVGGAPSFWTSLDGTAWAERTDPDLPCGKVYALSASESGFVAGGAIAAELVLDGRATRALLNRPAVWTSADGSDWSPATGLDSLGPGVVASVARGPRGYAAIVTLESGLSTGFLWSADGMSWTESPYRTPIEPGEARAVAVAGGPAGYLAVGGMLDAGRNPSGPAAWWSADGQSWQRIIGDPVAKATTTGDLFVSVAAFGDQFAIVGSSGTIWLLTPPGV